MRQVTNHKMFKMAVGAAMMLENSKKSTSIRGLDQENQSMNGN